MDDAVEGLGYGNKAALLSDSVTARTVTFEKKAFTHNPKQTPIFQILLSTHFKSLRNHYCRHIFRGSSPPNHVLSTIFCEGYL